MNNVIQRIRPRILPGVIIGFFIVSFVLGFHNATLYHPYNGFDGEGHIWYIGYVHQHWNIPPPDLNWETHQSPLYYFIGALLMSLTGTWKIAQYINIFVLWAIIGVVAIGLNKVFGKRDQVLLGVAALAALPMLNIFPAMITNELLSTFWIIAAVVTCLFVVTSRNDKEFVRYSIWLAVLFILGFWTKVSILMIVPVIAVTYFYVILQKKIERKLILQVCLIAFLFVSIMCLPILLRSFTSKGPSNVAKDLLPKSASKPSRPLSFYYRLDWIPKVDMYNTQYYSMTGGAWNSFWSDGHNAITPFVKFHKKAFVLWCIGFILFPISIYGLYVLKRMKKSYALVIITTGITMLFVYVYVLMNGTHYSAVRLTYEMAIVVPYVFGIVSAYENKKLRGVLWIIIGIQFIIMVSFFWIIPWWHVARPPLPHI